MSGPTFLEFFAGGGMARMGLGTAWTCLAANDASPLKCAAYRSFFGDEDLIEADIRTLGARDFPVRADLAWASFPCQDLSLAGARVGLEGSRSSLFWEFWRILDELDAAQTPAPLLAIENVAGLVTSRNGEDFSAVCAALARSYWVGGFVADAALWLPQSRPRLFLIASKAPPPASLVAEGPDPLWHPQGLARAVQLLDRDFRDRWVWWRLPKPPRRSAQLSDLLLPDEEADWHTERQTKALLAMMSPLHLRRVEDARAMGTRQCGALYRRTREGRQRAEVRFDGVAGCLRTPAGGSSRQTILMVEGARVRSRLLAPRETARLMGIPDGWPLPARQNAGHAVAGDGVAVPVVSWIGEHLLLPLVKAQEGALLVR